MDTLEDAVKNYFPLLMGGTIIFGMLIFWTLKKYGERGFFKKLRHFIRDIITGLKSVRHVNNQLGFWVASMVMKTDKDMGLLANVVVGIVGAFIGGWALSLFGAGDVMSGFNVASFLTALLGAVILLALLKMFRR